MAPGEGVQVTLEFLITAAGPLRVGAARFGAMHPIVEL